MSNTPDWSGGYVTDIDYTYHFFRELSPLHLRFSALMAGYRPFLQSVPPPSQSEKFVYCELGCGNGVSTNIFAAAHPEGQFFGIDYMPSHINFASGLARQAGLDNIHFLEADFRQLDKEDIPSCDFIVCHGVYSWISQENQAAIRKFVKEKLKPGGIFYVSYNCLPGWAAKAPIQHLYHMFGHSSQGDTLEQVDQAMAKFDQAFATGKGYFEAQQQSIQKQLNAIKKQEKSYVPHEYFNQDWHLFYHTDIISQFQEAKLSWVGSAVLFDLYIESVLGEEAKQILDQYKDPGIKETLKDYFINKQFRKDVFMRGPLKISPREQSRLLLETKFCLTVLRENLTLEMTINGANFNGKADTYLPIADALAESPKTLAELVNLPALEGKGLANVLQTVCCLMDSGQASICEPLNKKAQKSMRQMNLAILEQAQYAKKIDMMLCPSARTGIGVSWLQQIFIKALLEKQSPEQVAWQAMLALGERMPSKEGKPLTTEQENLAALHDKFLEFEKIRPQIFKLLGLDGKA